MSRTPLRTAPLRLFVAALLVGGCAVYVQPAEGQGVVQSGSRFDRAFFAGTVWRIHNPGGNPEFNWVTFRDDGMVGYSSSSSTNFTFDGNDRWAVEDGQLVIRWTDGYSLERYVLSGDGSVFQGKKSSQSWAPSERRPVSIRRVR